MTFRSMLLSATIISAITFSGLSLQAGESMTLANAANQTTNHYQSLTAQDKAIKVQTSYDFMLSLYEAQKSLNSEKSALAKAHLDAAMRQLTRITDDNILEVSEGKKVIELEFGSTFTPKVAVIPVTVEPVNLSNLNEMINLSGFSKGEIDRATIRHVSSAIDMEEAVKQLKEAQAAIERNDFYSAQYDLLQIQRDMLSDDNRMIPARTLARDHIALTQFMLKKGQYEAARELMDSAEDALKIMAEGTDDMSSLATMRQDIKQLSTRLKAKDPTLLDQMNIELEGWLEQLS